MPIGVTVAMSIFSFISVFFGFRKIVSIVLQSNNSLKQTTQSTVISIE